METATIRIPVKATMRKVGERYEMVNPVWADVPVDTVAALLAQHLGMPEPVKKGEMGQ